MYYDSVVSCHSKSLDTQVLYTVPVQSVLSPSYLYVTYGCTSLLGAQDMRLSSITTVNLDGTLL
jgi:hypothetical protein